MNDQDWDELIRALHHESDIDQAVAAAQRLHKTATAEDLPRLMTLLYDDDFFVREAAAWPASELAGPSALQELLVAYQKGLDQGHDNDGFTAALIDLVETNRETSREVLRRLAEGGDEAMRENALWLLEFCGETSGA
jgi:HEAT repeat protein